MNTKNEHQKLLPRMVDSQPVEWSFQKHRVRNVTDMSGELQLGLL